MIGNFSFEEHDRYFTRMYNHLKFIDRSLDDATIINVIKSKVMIEQELENIKYNLNIKNISDTPMVKDFKIWSAKYDVQSSETQSEFQSEDEDSEAQSEVQNEDEINSEAQSSDMQNEDEIDSEATSGDFQSEDETQSEDEIDSDDRINSDDIYDFYGIDGVQRYCGNSTAQRYRDISDIPDDY